MTVVPSEKIVINKTELKARLYGAADSVTQKLASSCENELRKAAECAYCFRETCISVTGDSCDLGFMAVKSKALAKSLAGCRNAYVFAATAGHGTDRLIRSKAVISPLAQFVTDAVASAFTEALCDFVQNSLPKPSKARFSPGYGDLPLEIQSGILAFLNKDIHDGIMLTESNLMVPSKSVTAIMGIIE